MKKISIMFATLVAALGFSSCNETWDDNPVLGVHEGDPVENFLNEPEMANMAVDITEANNAETFNLTCSQPEQYGYAASVGYQVEVALKEDFTTPAVEGVDASVLLSTIFKDCSQINPTRRSIAEAICKLLNIQDASQVPTDYMPVYMRLHANVVNENGDVVPGTAFTSNTVCFKAVRCGYLAIIVPGRPTGYYIRGNMNGWLNTQLNDGLDLDILPNYEFLTTTEADTYELDYIEIEANVEFKIADKGWADLNLGIGNSPIEFGKKVELGWNTSNIILKQPFKGSITLSGSGKNWSVTFDALEAETPGLPSGIFIRGDFNNWNAENQFITTDTKGVWECTGLVIGGGTTFKVADANWGDVNLGAHKTDDADAPIVEGVKYALENGGSNILCPNAFRGKAVLRLKGGKYNITLMPE